MAFRLFDRSRLYIDFQYKLMQNMHLGAQAAKQEISSILVHYKDVKSYHDAEDRKKNKELQMMLKKQEANGLRLDYISKMPVTNELQHVKDAKAIVDLN